MNIKDLIGEATEYDKKLVLEEKKPKSWCKSVSAFANTFGGALIFGISDAGQIVGLGNPEGDAEKISEVIKSRLDPIPEFKLRFHKADDEKILVNGSEVHIDIYDDRMEIYSPGGMPDGSMIQDRDPLTVPSTRRNPVLADVFNRLGYMERKGSGFGKIISGYEFQINYNESKTPSFRSDRYQFTVVMPNLNYNVPQDVPQDVPQGVPQDKLDAQIMDLIRKDSKISTEKMAIALGVSSKTIKRHLKEMDHVNYIGRGFSGHWEIMDNE